MGEVASQTLLKKGAEASLYLADWHEKRVVIKARLPKKYRPAELDEKIRGYRTAHEPQLMHEAKKAGVPTPTIFLVDVKSAVIIMEFIEGKQVKQLLESFAEKEREKACVKIGELIGKLHMQGVIHGDLTTSNMILNPEGKIFLVDFGLGEKTMELEARGVDLHLMKRALQSTHYLFAEECFEGVIRGYAAVLGEEHAKDVLDKIREIEKRGRYVADRGQESKDEV
jgi:TP53 regulating kinase-like protein